LLLKQTAAEVRFPEEIRPFLAKHLALFLAVTARCSWLFL
jgi:hypothetical protein